MVLMHTPATEGDMHKGDMHKGDVEGGMHEGGMHENDATDKGEASGEACMHQGLCA